jgi:LysM repeat protein
MKDLNYYQRLFEDLEYVTSSKQHSNSIQKLSSESDSLDEFLKLEKEAQVAKQVGKGLDWAAKKVKDVGKKVVDKADDVAAKGLKLQNLHIDKALKAMNALPAALLKNIQSAKSPKQIDKIIETYEKNLKGIRKLGKESPEVAKELTKLEKTMEDVYKTSNNRFWELTQALAAPSLVKEGLKMMAKGGIMAAQAAASNMKAPIALINAQAQKHPWISMLGVSTLTWLFSNGYLKGIVADGEKSKAVPTPKDKEKSPPTKEELATANITIQQLMAEAQKAGIVDPTEVRDFILKKLSTPEKKSSIRSFTRYANTQNDLAKKMVQDSTEFADAYNKVYKKIYSPKQIQKHWQTTKTPDGKAPPVYPTPDGKAPPVYPTPDGKAPTQSPAKQTFTDYTIREGDTLNSIAQKSKVPGLTWQHLAELNKIKNPNLIFVGKRLQIPSSVNKDTPKFQGQLPTKAKDDNFTNSTNDPTKDQYGFPKTPAELARSQKTQPAQPTAQQPVAPLSKEDQQQQAAVNKQKKEEENLSRDYRKERSLKETGNEALKTDTALFKKDPSNPVVSDRMDKHFKELEKSRSAADIILYTKLLQEAPKELIQKANLNTFVEEFWKKHLSSYVRSPESYKKFYQEFNSSYDKLKTLRGVASEKRMNIPVLLSRLIQSMELYKADKGAGNFREVYDSTAETEDDKAERERDENFAAKMRAEENAPSIWDAKRK